MKYHKLGDWGIKITNDEGKLIDIKVTNRHKIRQSIGLTGSMINDGKVYWFYGLVKKEYSWFDKIHNKLLKKLTHTLNKIL